MKYGQTMRDGSEETKINQMEMNDFLDPILGCVLHHGGERAIVFSSFNPDICTMWAPTTPATLPRLIHKQNKYPVLLLTQGQNTKYPDFRDPRCPPALPTALQDLESAAGRPLRRDGRSPGALRHGGGSYQGPRADGHGEKAWTGELPQTALNSTQVIFCWTDEDNSKESVLALKNLGVDGVIFDRMDQNKTEMFVAEGR